MGSHSKFKVNTSLLSDLATKVAQTRDIVNSMKIKVGSYRDSAQMRLNKWATGDYVSRHVRTIHKSWYRIWEDGEFLKDEYGNYLYNEDAYDRACNKAQTDAQNWYDAQVKEYTRMKNAYGDKAEKMYSRIKKIDKLMTVIKNAVTSFESFSLDLEAAKNYVNNFRSKEEGEVYSTFTYGDNGEKIYHKITLEFEAEEVTDIYGHTFKIYKILTMYHGTSQMEELQETVAAAETAIGGTAVREAQLAAGFMLKGLDNEKIDELLLQDVGKARAAATAALSQGAFNLNHDQNGNRNPRTAEQAMDDFYRETIDPDGHYSRETVQQILYEHDKETFTEDELKAMNRIGTYIAETSGAMVSTGVSSPIVAGSAATEPYDLVSYLEELGIPTNAPRISETPLVSETPLTLKAGSPFGETLNPFGGGGCGGGGGGCGGGTPTTGTDTPFTLPEITGDTPTQGPAITITQVTADAVPKTIEPNIAATIDAQAKEIFYSRTPEQIASERSSAMSAVEAAFNGEKVEEFKSLLKEGGFDDVTIDFIMENKEVAVTAYILASESKSLTDIANKLAIANDIQNFDTIYDNGLSRLSLEDGMSASRLLADVDDDVVEARNTVRTARTKYNNSVKKANESIDEANKKKEEMEELRKKIVNKSGEDTSKWDEDDVEAYNKAIEAYNNANKAANDAHRAALEDRTSLEQAQTKLAKVEEEATEKYMKAQQEEAVLSSSQGEEPISTAVEPIDTPPEITEVPQVETPIGDNPQGTLTTDNVVGDADGNITINIEPEAAAQQPTKSTFVNLEDAPAASTKGIVEKPIGVSTEVAEPKDLASDDILNLINNLDEVANVSEADMSLGGMDLGSLDTASEAGGLEASLLPQEHVKAVESFGNGMVDLAEAVVNSGKQEVNNFQNKQLNNLSATGFVTDPAYTSSTVSEDEPEEARTRTVEGNKEVAGVKVEPKDVEKHTDGVLTNEETNVAAEISDDGRSLEYVELD